MTTKEILRVNHIPSPFFKTERLTVASKTNNASVTFSRGIGYDLRSNDSLPAQINLSLPTIDGLDLVEVHVVEQPVGERSDQLVLTGGEASRSCRHDPIMPREVPLTEMIVAIVTSVIGSGGLWAFLQWVMDRRRQTVRRDELAEVVERALADSPTIRGINAKLDRDFARMERQDEWNRRHDEEMRQDRLVSLRQCLFAHPRDRNAHESALESGREYIAMGGNGTGHIRLEQLEDDYRRRLEADDWDYTERRP